MKGEVWMTKGVDQQSGQAPDTSADLNGLAVELLTLALRILDRTAQNAAAAHVSMALDCLSSPKLADRSGSSGPTGAQCSSQ